VSEQGKSRQDLAHTLMAFGLHSGWDVTRTYTHRETESAVAISGDLHGHLKFDDFVARHDQLLGASERWRLCIQAAIELEKVALDLAVEWGETHDYYLAIEMLVDAIIHQPELDILAATRSALSGSHL
jgi:hypothetical protein